jgi:hypothetical protein
MLTRYTIYETLIDNVTDAKNLQNKISQVKYFDQSIIAIGLI